MSCRRSKPSLSISPTKSLTSLPITKMALARASSIFRTSRKIFPYSPISIPPPSENPPLATDLMQEIAQQTRSLGIQTLEDIRLAPQRIASLSPEMEEKRSQTKAYLYANLYQSPALEAEHALAEEVIQTLFAAWTAEPELLPPDHL